MSRELWRRGGTELAAMVADGTISAREVIDAHLDRIDEVNGWRNAGVRVDAEGARAAADTVDQARATGETLRPLAGVPFTVKDGLDLAGHPTTYGIPAFADNVAMVDDPTIGRLRAAGAIPIAPPVDRQVARPQRSPRVWLPWASAQTLVARSATRPTPAASLPPRHR